jgi:hypothetical protein
MQYQIRSTRYFYGPIKTKFIVEDACYGPLVLPSRRAALEWIKSQDDTVYYLSHNEHSRPTYTLVPIR